MGKPEDAIEDIGNWRTAMSKPPREGAKPMNVILHETPANSIKGLTLRGQKTGADWVVGSKITKPKGGSGGNFSVGYKVTSLNDQEAAFLKATDVSLMCPDRTKSNLDRLAEALNHQRSERKLLDACSGNALDRIVRAIDYGETEIAINGVSELVFYIIFEKATGDIRTEARHLRNQGIAWIPRVSHNLAVATSQLHNAGISHNDIKPSNLLVFDAFTQKLGDLGRATGKDIPGPWDGIMDVGDQNYSAPEAWGYGYIPAMNGSTISHDSRRKSDTYMLGSLIFFLLTEQPLNNVMTSYINPMHRGNNWRGSFGDVVPYLRDAHGEAMGLMEWQVKDSYGDIGFSKLQEICGFVRYLTEVDPDRRGDPQNGLKKESSLCDLQRLISRTDRVARELEITEKP